MSTTNFSVLTDSQTVEEVVNCLTEHIPIKTQDEIEGERGKGKGEREPHT